MDDKITCAYCGEDITDKGSTELFLGKFFCNRDHTDEWAKRPVDMVVVPEPVTQMNVHIFATDKYGNRDEITNNLYWFEENGVQNLGGEGHWGQKYIIEIVLST